MRLIGGLIVLLFIVMGFGCIWVACEGAWEMITIGSESRAELVGNWFMIALMLVFGLLSSAIAPVLINEM